MSVVNNVILVGRLTADPEVRQGDNSSYGRATIAVQRDFKNKEGNYDSDFINIMYSGTTAEFILKYFHKGDVIAVQGSIRTGSYTNKDGQKVYTTDVNVDKCSFVPGTKTSGENSGDSKPKHDDFMVIDNSEEMLPW